METGSRDGGNWRLLIENIAKKWRKRRGRNKMTNGTMANLALTVTTGISREQQDTHPSSEIVLCSAEMSVRADRDVGTGGPSPKIPL